MKRQEERGRGRPPKPPEERKAKFLKIRVNQEELDEFHRASGGNLSEWARGLLLKAAARKK
jgi:hypothetical protein